MNKVLFCMASHKRLNSDDKDTCTDRNQDITNIQQCCIACEHWMRSIASILIDWSSCQLTWFQHELVFSDNFSIAREKQFPFHYHCAHRRRQAKVLFTLEKVAREAEKTKRLSPINELNEAKWQLIGRDGFDSGSGQKCINFWWTIYHNIQNNKIKS